MQLGDEKVFSGYIKILDKYWRKRKTNGRTGFFIVPPYQPWTSECGLQQEGVGWVQTLFRVPFPFWDQPFFSNWSNFKSTITNPTRLIPCALLRAMNINISSSDLFLKTGQDLLVRKEMEKRSPQFLLLVSAFSWTIWDKCSGWGSQKRHEFDKGRKCTAGQL